MVELLVSRSENWWAIAYLNEQYAVGTLEIKLA